MYQCNADPTDRILSVSYSGHVGPKEVEQCLENVRSLSGVVQPGFFLFTDMSHLENMHPDCAVWLGKIMEECAKMGLAVSVRLIPPAKDIGLNLIAHFHYPPQVRSHTHETLAEALHALLSEYSLVSAEA